MQSIEDVKIELGYCPTEMMVADMLTKPLSKDRFWNLRQLMGLFNLTN